VSHLQVSQESETKMPKYPYTKAVLIHHNYDLDKRWWVELEIPWGLNTFFRVHQ
jgi:hypothetical protein